MYLHFKKIFRQEESFPLRSHVLWIFNRTLRGKNSRFIVNNEFAPILTWENENFDKNTRVKKTSFGLFGLPGNSHQWHELLVVLKYILLNPSSYLRINFNNHDSRAHEASLTLKEFSWKKSLAEKLILDQGNQGWF